MVYPSSPIFQKAREKGRGRVWDRGWDVETGVRDVRCMVSRRYAIIINQWKDELPMQVVRELNRQQRPRKKERWYHSEPKLLGLLPSVLGVTCNGCQEDYGIKSLEMRLTKVTVRRCLPVLRLLKVKFPNCGCGMSYERWKRAKVTYQSHQVAGPSCCG
jgi:hypothetical protein